MADLPTPEEVEENITIGDDYEHPEPTTTEGGCSNLGEMPDELYYSDVDEDPEDTDE